MIRPPTVAEAVPSPREELANSLSHGLGLVGAIAATPLLVLAATAEGAAAIVGVSIFGASMIALYLASTLYHALPAGPGKRVFRVLDHSAIYLLIAGTYTPFTLGVLRGGWGWALFGVIWGLAVAGLTFKAFAHFRFPRVSTGIYVAMGWVVIVALPPLVRRMPPAGLLWLVLGGLAYTGGVVFYLSRRRWAHFIWHLFVLTGTVCHAVAVAGWAT